MARRTKRGYYLDRYVDASRLGSGSRLDLFYAVVKDKTRTTVDKLRSLGLSKEADVIAREARKVSDAEIKDLTRDALKTARKHVPIDSRELQDRHIHEEYSRDENGNLIGYVFIDGDDHYGSRRRKAEKASILAAYLDKPNRRLNRSRANGPHNRGESTRNWIRDAKNDFRERKAAIIRREI